MTRLARRQWAILLAGLLLGIVGALAFTAITPDRYESSVSMYLSAASAEGDVALDAQSATLAEQRTASYSQFVTSLRLADEVSSRLRLGIPADELADEITVSTVPDSAVIRATVTDTDPQRARAVADTVGTVFVELVAQFEQPRDPARPPTVTARILDSALVPSQPVSPVLSLDLGLGVVLGAVLGVAAAAVRETTDTRVRDAEDLGAVFRGPVLAVTPVGVLTAEDVAFSRPRQTAAVEAFRRLRTHLFLALGEGARVVAVTSPQAGEGRTSTTIQLALALHEDGRRVCVVEADLRGATAAPLLGVDATSGLSDVLVGRLSADAATQRFANGPDVLVAGHPVVNPAELLGGPSMAALLRGLRRRYDAVLVDTPPSRSLTDALVVASQADASLLVVRSGMSTAPAVRAAVADLEASRVRVAGAVIVGGVPAPHDTSGERKGTEPRAGLRTALPGSRRPALEGSAVGAPPEPSHKQRHPVDPSGASARNNHNEDDHTRDEDATIPSPRTFVGLVKAPGRPGNPDEA